MIEPDIQVQLPERLAVTGAALAFGRKLSQASKVGIPVR
jgi:hypothetical protein